MSFLKKLKKEFEELVGDDKDKDKKEEHESSHDSHRGAEGYGGEFYIDLSHGISLPEIYPLSC
jgi:hypothetical protein